MRGQKYGIHGIPSNYLLDKNGKIIAKYLRGEDMLQAVSKVIGG
jgi:hypothetical protein